MATPEEKQRLYDALAFTPRNYKLSIWGYGGEIVMGTIPREIYDYFRHRRLSVESFASDYDYADEHDIPAEMWPFEPGSWYECDDMAHVSGANTDCSTIQVTDESGTVVSECSADDMDLDYTGETYITSKPPGTVVFIGRSGEKGTFFGGEIPLTTPFDAEKLTLFVDEVDGEEFIVSAQYDGEDIDNNDYDTNGKSSDYGFYLVKPDHEFETYRDHDSIDYPLTPWFPRSAKPSRTGVYMITGAGRNGYEYQAQWTGTRWINSWSEDKPEAVTLNIKRWRGVSINPDEVVL